MTAPANEDSHIASLTGLRGFAALWVCLYHTWAFSGHTQFVWRIGSFEFDPTPLVAMGGAGVTVFFVLSGFLLAQPFARWHAGKGARPNLGRYLLHRVVRVFPAYYVQLATLLLVATLSSSAAVLPDVDVLLKHLVMLFVPPPIGTVPLNLVWWTLPIEFSFYLILPFVAVLLRPDRLWMLFFGSLVSMGLWRYAVILQLADAPLQLRVYASYQLAGSFDMFGLGMCAAMVSVNRDRLVPWISALLRRWYAPVAGLGVMIVAVYWLAGERHHYWSNHPVFYLWTPLLSLGTVTLILSGVLGNRVVRALFGNRLMAGCGLVSYSLYLWHVPLHDWIVHGNWYRYYAESGFIYLIIWVYPVLFLVSLVSYWCVERPFLRWRSGRVPN